jgi:hypothetical protein
MKFVTALLLSAALAIPAAPVLAQPGREHDRGGQGGQGYERRGGGGQEPRGGGEDRRWPGGWGERRGGYAYPRDAYSGPRGAYSERPAHPGYGGAYPEPPRNGGYGYAAPAPEARPQAPYGGWARQQDEVREGVSQGRYMGLARVIGIIRQRTPGRQLDAGLEDWGGRAVYRVRWAEPGGRRIDYIVDAQSGAILHVDGR